MNGFTSRRFYSGEVSGIEYFNGLASHKGNPESIYNRLVANLQNFIDKLKNGENATELHEQVPFVLQNLEELLTDVKQKHNVPVDRLQRSLYRAAAYTIALPKVYIR